MGYVVISGEAILRTRCIGTLISDIQELLKKKGFEGVSYVDNIFKRDGNCLYIVCKRRDKQLQVFSVYLACSSHEYEGFDLGIGDIRLFPSTEICGTLLHNSNHQVELKCELMKENGGFHDDNFLWDTGSTCCVYPINTVDGIWRQVSSPVNVKLANNSTIPGTKYCCDLKFKTFVTEIEVIDLDSRLVGINFINKFDCISIRGLPIVLYNESVTFVNDISLTRLYSSKLTLSKDDNRAICLQFLSTVKVENGSATASEEAFWTVHDIVLALDVFKDMFEAAKDQCADVLFHSIKAVYQGEVAGSLQNAEIVPRLRLS